MFNTTIKSEKIKDAMEIIGMITDEATFHVSQDGLKVSVVDPAIVAMVSVELSKEAFSSFEVTDCELAIDITKLRDVLEMAGKDEDVALELDEEKHKLIIRLHGLAYTMTLLDPGTIRKEPKIPSLQLPVSVELKGEELKRAVKAAEKITEYLWLGIEDGNFLMQCDGDIDSVRALIGKDECISMNPGVQGDVRSLFSLDYLSDFAKVAGKVDKLSLELGKDMPLIGRFTFADRHGDVRYMQAPSVSED